MKIEGRYYVPDSFGEAVQSNADLCRKVQFVGLLYNPKPALPPGPERLGVMWADLASGRDCSWVYGPDREELIAEYNPAVVLWVYPEAA